MVSQSRQLMSGQRTRVWTWALDDASPTLVYESRAILLEAPNWLPDGRLLVNGDGRLHLLDLTGRLDVVAPAELPRFNNDHVPAPSGTEVYASAQDGQIYSVSLSAHTARRVTQPSIAPGLLHFLHGVSPDGDLLAFVGIETDGAGTWQSTSLFTVTLDGQHYRRLTDGTALVDGCEYSPDGEWIYYNSEEFDGHAQIARRRADGTDPQQLTFDANVNWFPHLSPDGRYASYIAFPPGTEGHPPDVVVDIKVVELPAWDTPTTVARISGGQGSLNVNSWRADSGALAFASYPTGDL